MDDFNYVNAMYIYKSSTRWRFQLANQILLLSNSYDIMTQCWQTNAAQRPTFTELRHKFESMLESSLEYLTLDINPSNVNYYHNHSSSLNT